MAHRQINFTTPIENNRTLKLMSVSGFKISDMMAFYNSKDLIAKGIVEEPYQWCLCFKVQDVYYWRIASFKTRKEALEEAQKLEQDLIIIFKNSNILQELINKINEMEFYH